MKQLYTTLIFCMAFVAAQAQTTISIIAPKALLDTSITALTIQDVQGLLKQACLCNVTVNDTTANVLLRLPAIDAAVAAQPNSFARQATFPYKNYPQHDYEWVQYTNGPKITLDLKTASWQGVSFGLYGLLQEKLGFKFYHPRNTLIPKFTVWPIQDFKWQAKALFDKKGFHLHTQHHTELTEQLHDGNMDNALRDVKEYINWLARNGQNYFEFCLLESIDRKVWPEHAKNIVDYVHARGLIAAVDLSLHMIQQKTFQLYRSNTGKKKQIEKSLVWLMQADWDVINMEFSTAEFIAGNYRKKEALRQQIIQWLLDNTEGTKLMGRQHVVRHENEMGHKKNKKKGFEWDSASIALDRQRGVLSHTVMFYDMTEENAPVYRNKNQRHQFQFLKDQMKIRETWYYPESAYWVTFDNSVPMMLLPYLTARLSDIDTCVAYNVPGHITFSSGWEWGYYLFDWSIARWSWRHVTNGVLQERTPTMFANELANANKTQDAFKASLALQQQYLKDSTMMQYMTAMTITDEIGLDMLNDEYHPRPKVSYKLLQRKATQAEVNEVKSRILPQLTAFSSSTAKQVAELKSTIGKNQTYDTIVQEWIDGIEITGLRAQHRYYVLKYILSYREAKLNKQKFDGTALLDSAAAVRSKALEIVKRREQHYRYPLELIATRAWDHTSYHFGYLYTVSQLHFWNREEQEARKNKYSPWFMNIWNVGRIAGFIN